MSKPSIAKIEKMLDETLDNLKASDDPQMRRKLLSENESVDNRTGPPSEEGQRGLRICSQQWSGSGILFADRDTKGDR
jgi:hypothetical protein